MVVNMKNEFFEYVCPAKRITKNQIDSNKSKTKKDDIIGFFATFFILFVFSLPMAISKIGLFSIVLISYFILLVACKIDKDPYSKTMLFFGSTTLYLGIVLSYLIITESYKRFHVSSLLTLLVLTIFAVIFYEILVCVNIVFKRYTPRLTKKSYPMIYTTIGTFCGAIIGSLIARCVSPYLEESLWSVWLVLIACSLLFTVSFSLFQKCILYKIFYKKIITERNACE